MKRIVELALVFIGVLHLSHAEVTLQDDPSLWPGHLEPLAAKSKKTSVETLDTFPTAEVFFKEYVSKIKPVAIRGGAKLSKAFSLWSDDYFKSLPGADKLKITAESGKKENRTNPPKTISFKQFVETYKTEDIYMVNGVPDFLQYPVVEVVPSVAAKVVVPGLNKVFSEFGVPEVVRSDNRPPFNGEDFRKFASVLGFKHRKVTPLWPRANGEVERFMRTLKKTIEAAKVNSCPWKEELCDLLRNYRATPHSSTGKAPASVLFDRPMRVKLPEAPQCNKDPA